MIFVNFFNIFDENKQSFKLCTIFHEISKIKLHYYELNISAIFFDILDL